MATIGLAMISKNCADHIGKTIENVAPFVDDIVVIDNGSTDNTVKVAKKAGARVIELNPKDNPEYFCELDGEFLPNFTRLRRKSFEESKADWVMWLDSDDIVQNAHLIPDKVGEAELNKINSIVCRYLYELDKEGNIIREHTKERIVRKDMFKWEFDEDWAVHENLYPIDPKKASGHIDSDIIVIHEKEEQEHAKSNTRNFKLLKWMLQKEKFQKDARVWFLLGRELMGLQQYGEAVKVFNKYLSMEYAAHDALETCILLAEIHEGITNFDAALGYSLKAIQVRPDHPLGYIYAARYFNYQAKHKEALDMLETAKKKRNSILDNYVQQPYKQSYLYAKAEIDAYYGRKEYEKAVEVIDNNIDYTSVDDRKEFEGRRSECVELMAEEKLSSSLETIVQNRIGELQKDKKQPTIADFEDIFSLFRGHIKLSPLYMKVRKYCGDFREHGKDEITIIHQSNFEDWDYESLQEKGGGGSETACAELATQWVKAGYKVTVYAAPKVEREIEGVSWKRYENINLADKFNIFISLRSTSIFTEYHIDADRKYLWLQDIMMAEQYTPELINQLDKIIVLSKYHRDTAYDVPESKFYYTTNGINLKWIEEIERENIERIKNKCVYISSADRGLINLIEYWPDVKKEVPGATCYDFYGWNSWNIHNLPEQEKRKQELVKGMKKAGIIEGGRISKKDLYRHLFSADFHTYPLIGPAETSCIAVMESQACGAVPITTGITALEETQQFGLKVPLPEYKQKLIDTMKSKRTDESEYRAEMMKWARETFNWERVAKAWIDDLFVQ